MEKMTLTLKEAAEELNVCLATLCKLIKKENHPIPTAKLGDSRKARRFISREALKKWIEEETEMTMKARK